MRKLAIALCLMAPTVFAADLSGVWELRITGGELDNSRRLKLEAKDGKFVPTDKESEFTFTSEGDSVKVICLEDKHDCGSLTGTLANGVMSGEGVIEGIPMKWTARRPVARAASAQRHEFTPVVFHREFSGAKEPALRIYPGDTVHTKTVDAGGRDEASKHRVFGGNPLTGPFYIEGAMPGDTLVVKFTRVRLNRDSAGSGDRVVASALEPYAFRNLPKVEQFDSEWKLDREAGVGMLKNPTDKLKNYRVPLKPMLGCVGVAPPAKQSFRAGWLGDWGGNMDYNQLREGTTAYLPVNVPGALLFVGDGHAAQGDGELTGDALETSMEVEFTVSLLEGGNQRAPRFENDEFVMTSGIANSYQDALQKATTAMSRYLTDEYKLNPAEVGIVLGTAIKYDIAEIVDPQIHIVAKLPRTALAGLSRP